MSWCYAIVVEVNTSIRSCPACSVNHIASLRLGAMRQVVTPSCKPVATRSMFGASSSDRSNALLTKSCCSLDPCCFCLEFGRFCCFGGGLGRSLSVSSSNTGGLLRWIPDKDIAKERLQSVKWYGHPASGLIAVTSQEEKEVLRRMVKT